MNTKQTEALKLALEALEFYDEQGIGRTPGVKAITAIREALAEQPAPVAKPHKQQEPVSWERFMAVEKELQDMTAEFMRVANELAAIKTQQQDPVSIEYWSQDTMESGRWVTIDNMARATAGKMLSGEYGDVYPQGRIVEPPPQPTQQQEPDKYLLEVECTKCGATEQGVLTFTPPASKPLPEDYTALEQALTRLQKRYADLEGRASKPLTDAQIERIYETPEIAGSCFENATDKAIALARAIEAAHGIK